MMDRQDASICNIMRDMNILHRAGDREGHWSLVTLFTVSTFEVKKIVERRGGKFK